ncbi:MAG TPA: hypothetical protein VL689_19260 [Paraburkholderia sp.]|nr:hypothetical protein [Paraburkholderia sp.]
MFTSLPGVTLLPLATSPMWRNGPSRRRIGAREIARRAVAMLTHGVSPAVDGRAEPALVPFPKPLHALRAGDITGAATGVLRCAHSIDVRGAPRIDAQYQAPRERAGGTAVGPFASFARQAGRGLAGRRTHSSGCRVACLSCALRCMSRGGPRRCGRRAA